MSLPVRPPAIRTRWIGYIDGNTQTGPIGLEIQELHADYTVSTVHRTLGPAGEDVFWVRKDEWYNVIERHGQPITLEHYGRGGQRIG